VYFLENPVMNKPLFYLMMAALVLFGISPAHADGQAVSALNGKISAEGGITSGDGAGLANASITAPIGKHFGFQGDASAGKVLGDFAGSVGGHFFTRDPERYLVGIEGGYATASSAHIQRMGGEAELYINRFTFSGKAAYQFGDTSQKIKFLDGFVGGAGLTVYPIENLSIGGGASLNTGTLSGYGEAEYQPAFFGNKSLSFFTRGQMDGEHKGTIMAGIRLYIGQDKPLIRRHREDDPPSFMNGGSSQLTSEIATARTRKVDEDREIAEAKAVAEVIAKTNSNPAAGILVFPSGNVGFSNRCGTPAPWCLIQPGEIIGGNLIAFGPNAPPNIFGATTAPGFLPFLRTAP
jgi:hypothetical protein